ncbi:hypothetical protein SDC9_202886 [bioreactor metagenome]|uniref:Uncharacterized protein n=1 Tax=bioreactor metagenome TaxID=1076179 RepID=A0A645IVP1_9ZZZZ
MRSQHGAEAVIVGIGPVELAVFYLDCIDCTDACGFRCDFVQIRHHCLFVGNRDIDADEPQHADPFDRRFEFAGG